MNTRTLALTASLLSLAAIRLLAAPPEVTDVQASQRAGAGAFISGRQQTVQPAGAGLDARFEKDEPFAFG